MRQILQKNGNTVRRYSKWKYSAAVQQMEIQCGGTANGNTVRRYSKWKYSAAVQQMEIQCGGTANVHRLELVKIVE